MTITKVYVVIRRPRPVAAFLSMAKAILQAVTNAKATFPTPNPSLATLTTDISSFDSAQSSALTRAKGAVQARNAAMVVVSADLDLLRGYVQQVADADPSNALAIAHSAGMDLRKTPVRSKNDLNAKPGTTSGTLAVSARVGGVRASHEWQYSIDGGKTWISLPSSLQAKTMISGLTPLTTVMVRHCAVTKAGPQDWSQPISAVVQ
jgi:hypothetical protein